MSKELVHRFEKAGMRIILGDVTGYYGEAYPEALFSSLICLLEQLNK
ncbi:MAG: hypothetical protein JW881_11865 [Spirochaetales bacterium]|nr:hypothetical protein [Spirochaetales bacterium]